METCPVKGCGKEIKNKTGLSSHMRNSHKLTMDGKAYKRVAKPKRKPVQTHAKRAKCPYCTRPPRYFATEHGVAIHIHHAHRFIPTDGESVTLTRFRDNHIGLVPTRGKITMTQKKDETLIRLRDTMNENEILTVVEDCSNVLHRLVQISIDAGARANQIFFNQLCTAAASLENTVYAAKQAERSASPIHIPGGPTPFGRPQ